MQLGTRLRTVSARLRSLGGHSPTRWGKNTGIGITATENVLADRSEAGRILAQRLMPLRAESPVVLALPCGGVPVAVEIADTLGAPLDVLLVDLLSPVDRPASAFGCMGEGGVALLDVPVTARAGVSGEELVRVESEKRADLKRKSDIYRRGRRPVAIDGRTAIIVADGLDNENLARAAVRLVRERGARRVILALPVAPLAALHRLQWDADVVVSLLTPKYLVAVGLWYRDFAPTPDDEVVAILQTHSNPVDQPPCRDPARTARHNGGG